MTRLAGTLERLALVVVLVGLVALLSQQAHVWALPLRSGSVDRTGILIAVALVMGLGLVVAAGLTMIAHRRLLAHRPGGSALRAMLLRALPLTAATLAALSLLMIARTDWEPRVETERMGSGSLLEPSDRRGVPLSINWWNSMVRAGPGEAEPEDPASGAGNRSSPFSRLVMVVGALALIAAGMTAWRLHARRHSFDSGTADESRQGAVHGALVGTIDAMLADPDPNTAIRGAYARLLEGLEACGTGRRDHEAPMEHLHRVFTILHVRPQPLRRLIELFELARFSTRPLGPSHRDEALEALRDVAADLESDPAFRPRAGSARPLEGHA